MKRRKVMAGMDRRVFLTGTGLLSAGSLTSRLPASALDLAAAGQGANQSKDVLPQPVYEPFEWNAPGLVFSFEFIDKKIRSRTVLPVGVAPPRNIPPLAAISEIGRES